MTFGHCIASPPHRKTQASTWILNLGSHIFPHDFVNSHDVRNLLC